MEGNKIITKFETPVREACQIENTLFENFDVKRGLRNADGTGVLVGLTNIGDVVGYEKEDGKVIAIPGRLYYRGIDIVCCTPWLFSQLLSFYSFSCFN